MLHIITHALWFLIMFTRERSACNTNIMPILCFQSIARTIYNNAINIVVRALGDSHFQHWCDQLGSMCPGSTPVSQYDPYWSKNSRNKQDRGGSEKARCSQSETLLYHRTSAGPTYPCPECGRVLQARIGLISHLRTHRVNQTWHRHHHRRSYGHHRKRLTNNSRAYIYVHL